jgi:hypothetical protein
MTSDPPTKDKQINHALQMRRSAIGMAVAAERLLESLGHPVESAIVPRYERRRLTKREPTTKI